MKDSEKFGQTTSMFGENKDDNNNIYYYNMCVRKDRPNLWHVLFMWVKGR